MGLILGTDTNTGQPVTLSDEARYQGLYVVGGTGTGKSTLMVNMAVQDMEQGHGLCVLDPDGDFVRDIAARIPNNRRRDVIELDFSDESEYVGLNLFEVGKRSQEGMARSAEFAVEVFRKVLGDVWGAQLEDVFGNLAYTAVETGLTLREIPRLLSQRAFREMVISYQHDNRRESYGVAQEAPRLSS